MPSGKRTARRKCPACGSTKVLRIVYGYPGQELMERAQAGKVVLGGCCVGDNDPQWQCAECGEQWRREGR